MIDTFPGSITVIEREGRVAGERMRSDGSNLATLSAGALERLIGEEAGVSRWFALDQSRIDAFAEVAEDRQFIHTSAAGEDLGRARPSFATPAVAADWLTRHDLTWPSAEGAG